jgi:hypothetical protein
MICAESLALKFAMTATPDLKSTLSITASVARRNPIYSIHRVLSTPSAFSLNGSELGTSQCSSALKRTVAVGEISTAL